MPIELIHISDIHFGSGETHGRINPLTGLNIRFEDFVQALSKAVDYSIKNKIDVFLFAGDAYRNASPEPVYQKFFALELKRLSDHGIQTVMVVGNHDQIMRSHNSHSMSVFQSLQVPGMIIVDKPTFTSLETANGKLQLIGLPNVTRHQVMTIEKYSSLPAAALDRVLIEHVTALLRGYYDDLDPAIPAVVTAHMGMDTALTGMEQELLIGYTLSFPLEIFVNSKIDYVALGHIHKHQVVRAADPPILYSGSLERVDFGEEDEDKGFIHVSLQKGASRFKFCSVDPRPFVTVNVDLVKEENPMPKLEQAIQKALKPGCIMRVRFTITERQMSLIDNDKLYEQTAIALSTKLQPEIVQTQSRARMPHITEEVAASPLLALESYLDDVAPERKDRLLQHARRLAAELTCGGANPTNLAGS